MVRPDDENGVTDVFLVDAAQALAGNVLPYRYSMATLAARSVGLGCAMEMTQ